MCYNTGSLSYVGLLCITSHRAFAFSFTSLIHRRTHALSVLREWRCYIFLYRARFPFPFFSLFFSSSHKKQTLTRSLFILCSPLINSSIKSRRVSSSPSLTKTLTHVPCYFTWVPRCTSLLRAIPPLYLISPRFLGRS